MSFFLNPDLNIGKQQEFKGKKHLLKYMKRIINVVLIVLSLSGQVKKGLCLKHLITQSSSHL